MAGRRADWVLAAEPGSAARARELVVAELHELSGETLDIVVLLVSELVTNAVVHGSGAVGLSVVSGDGAMRIEVSDQSPTWPVLRELDLEAPNGRGLLFVDRLSSSWGVRQHDAGKVVWFTL